MHAQWLLQLVKAPTSLYTMLAGEDRDHEESDSLEVFVSLAVCVAEYMSKNLDGGENADDERYKLSGRANVVRSFNGIPGDR